MTIAVAGAGPAGLAVAIEAALAGHTVAVFERRRGPVDKACGEGVMPAGVAWLARRGVRRHLGAGDVAPFTHLTWAQEDGRAVSAPLPAPGGLGVRRVALAAAMLRRARELGVSVRDGCGVRDYAADTEGVTVETDDGPVRAAVLVAADGLHSPLRRRAGLHRAWRGPLRFGLRRHVAVAPWSDAVEVCFAEGVEAYVTPAGTQRVGVAFLWEDGAVPGEISFERLLARFPALRARVAGSDYDSTPRGAGPLGQRVTARTADRLVLVGDAAGYVDAITGEGLSLAFEGAATLARLLPDALERGCSRASLGPYERAMSLAYARYEALARALLWTARRPALRRRVLGGLIAAPSLFAWALSHAIPSGHGAPEDLVHR